MPEGAAGKKANFGSHLLSLAGIELVPREEEGDHLATSHAFASVTAAAAPVEEISIPHPDI